MRLRVFQAARPGSPSGASAVRVHHHSVPLELRADSGGERCRAGCVAVEANGAGCDRDPLAPDGNHAPLPRQPQDALGHRGCVLDQRAGLAARHERAPGSVAPVDATDGRNAAHRRLAGGSS